MCGICGFVGQGEWSDVQAMNHAITHRGPDDEGYWADETLGLYLGHRRLSIIDLEGGHQPMWSTDGRFGVIYNGEIYNHPELREILTKQGHVFQTDHSDTEVLLHGYREWGEDLPNYLNGMWVFAIVDHIEQTLFLSRDRFGKKPLFYTHQNATFAFSSELHSLLQHSFVESKLSTPALQKYFAYGYVPAPLSLCAGIFKLPAGHNLHFSLKEGTFTVQQYWDFLLEPTEASEATWCEQIRELLGKAVQRRMMADVPLGFLLSGGIDSSAVVSYGAQFSNQPISTFSVGFEEASFDESRHAQQVAQLLKTRHYSQILSINTLKALIPQIVNRLDEPLGDGSLLPTYLLCQEVRKQVKVALSGDGGDELFAGYDPFRALRMAEFYDRLIPGKVHQGIRLLMARMPVSHRNLSLDFKIKRTLQGLDFDKRLWNPVWLGPLSWQEISELFQEPLPLEEMYSEAIEVWDACQQPNLIDKTLQFYTKLYLQNDILVKIDRASMMHSLELRSPFLDIDLVNLVRRIPAHFKLKNGQTKYILKKALERDLPHNILYRSKKGFGMPIGQWFQEGSLSLGENPLSQIYPDVIQHKFEEHREGKANHYLFLWSYWLLHQMITQNPAFSNS